MIDKTILLIGDTIGAILQPIYFSLFLIYSKGIKTKKIRFTILMILEHFLLRHIMQIKFNINFELTYSIITYIVLKLIYKNKARITDMVTFIISTLFMGAISVIVYFIIGMNIYGLITTNILIIVLTYLNRHKLIKIDEFYNKFWNRHSNEVKLKSITVRGISSVLTVIAFILMHLWLIYGIYI